MSKGEDKVAAILRKNRIKFKQEVSFQDLHGAKKSLLRFDFAVYQNKQLYALIEVDGQQHFKFTPYFHKTKANFYKQLEWDRRKNKYCLLNRIPLIRIPYWALDNLTFNSIFTTPAYFVTNKYHNDLLIEKGVIK